MEEDLIALLIADEALDALADRRIYWVHAPQTVSKPYVVLHKITGIPGYHMEGKDGLEFARVQADCYGLTYASAVAAARAVDDVLSAYSGTTGSTEFQLIEREASRDGYEDEQSPDKLFSRSLDFTIWHKGA